MAKKSPEEEDALDILATLTEECGEVVLEIRKIERKGSKAHFDPTNNKEKLANELADESGQNLRVGARVQHFTLSCQ